MKQKTTRIACFAGIVLVMHSLGLATAAQMGTQKEGLKRLSPLAVYITGDSWLMSDSSLRTQVDLRLRRSGVPLNDECKPTSICVPQIYVELRAVKMSERMTYFSITVQCNIAVSPVGEPERRLLATVWLDGDSGVTLNNETEIVREKVAQLIDGFANDYLAANPKSHP